MVQSIVHQSSPVPRQMAAHPHTPHKLPPPLTAGDHHITESGECQHHTEVATNPAVRIKVKVQRSGAHHNTVLGPPIDRTIKCEDWGQRREDAIT